jgi:hypothetical protein
MGPNWHESLTAEVLMSQSMRTLAGSTRSVASGCTLLLRGLEVSPVVDSLVVERLEVAARRTLDGPAVTAMRFEPAEEATSTSAAPRDDDVLAQVLTDLTVGNALLAAGQAVGEGGSSSDPAALEDALRQLDEVAGVLDGMASREDRVRQGFEPVEPSVDPAHAAERLSQELDSVLEAMTTGCSGVVTDALDRAMKVAPAQLHEIVDQLGEKLQLGGRLGRLVGLGVAALERGLDALSRLFSLDMLRAARDDVRTLVQRLQTGDLGPAVLGWVIGVYAVRADAQQWSAGGAGRVDALDAAVAALRGLAERFAALVTFATGIVGAIAGAAALVSVLGIAVPNLALATGGAFLLVVAAVVLLGLDYTDARGLMGFVVGARTIVRDAWDVSGEPAGH